MLSTLYNLGVCHANIGSHVSLEGQGIKEASNNFQIAAWTFDHLKTLSTQLPPMDQSLDFTSENLTMLSNLMLA